MFKRLFKRKKYVWHALLIGLAVVFFWRGAWGLIDHFLFPDNKVLSDLTSLILGIGILYGTHHITKGLE